MIAHRPRTAVLAALFLLTGCGGGAAASPGPDAAPTRPGTPPAPTVTARAAPAPIPGLGPAARARIPGTAGQVVVVTGRDRDSPLSTVVLYRRTADGWRPGPAWPAHTALRGWSAHHTGGDLRSPQGVFTLSDAGGLRPDPGTRLPYHRSWGFTSHGTGFEGSPWRAPSTTSSPSTTTAGRAPRPSTGPGRSGRAAGAASGSTSTTAAPPTAASASVSRT